MSNVKHKKENKGRRWIFSKKKMKDDDGSDDDMVASNDLKTLLEDKGISLKPCVNIRKSSKLSPALPDVLSKPGPRCFFEHFLIGKGRKHLLDFWIEADTFRKTFRRPAWHTSGVDGAYCDFGGGSPDSHSPRIDTAKSHDSCGCSCIDTKNIEMAEELKSEVLDLTTTKNETLNTLEDKSTKSDVINSMHRSNHEWTDANKNPCLNCSSDMKEGGIGDEDLENSLELGFGGLFVHRSHSSQSVSSIASSSSPFPRGKNQFIDAQEIYNKYIVSAGLQQAAMAVVTDTGAPSIAATAITPPPPLTAVTTATIEESLIDIPETVKLQIQEHMEKNSIDANIFAAAQDHIHLQLLNLHQKFIRSHHLTDYQVKLLEERDIKFVDVLLEDHILFYFMEFLEQRGDKCRSVLEFFITARNFEEDVNKKLLSTDGEYVLEEVVSDAMNIYERYFSMKCEHRLIYDDKLRIVLENNICRDDGPQPNCFCIPLSYAWTALNEVFMPRFLLSEIYASYIDKLRKSSLQTLAPNISTSEKSGSSNRSSNRSSISLEDTPRQAEFKGSKIDLLEENNLEDFWFKEPGESSGGLTLGRVSEYGIFNSEMEPEPPPQEKAGESSVSKFGKKVKDFLRRETEEETEQLAWRRAEKIIADIQKETTLKYNAKPSP